MGSPSTIATEIVVGVATNAANSVLEANFGDLATN